MSILKSTHEKRERQLEELVDSVRDQLSGLKENYRKLENEYHRTTNDLSVLYDENQKLGKIIETGDLELCKEALGIMDENERLKALLKTHDIWVCRVKPEEWYEKLAHQCTRKRSLEKTNDILRAYDPGGWLKDRCKY